MKNPMHDLIAGATNFTRRGRLHEATAMIQRALDQTGANARAQAPGDTGVTVIDAPAAKLSRTASVAPLWRTVKPAATGAAEKAGAHFLRRTYEGAAGSRDYKLFVPAGPARRLRPLIVMLHGCKQDPDDFAAGTRMNELAQELDFLVLYPAQAPRSNASKCWNWFMPADQRRGRGEPALLAGMTQHVIATESVDPARVYVAGLSAGAAMAAILGREYPDLYAAVGIHSGLPQGAAHDVASAFSAMNTGSADAGALSRGARSFRASLPGVAAAPVIVFHGDRDRTVHPSNGADVISALLGETAADRIETDDTLAQVGGRDYTRTVYRQRGAAASAPSLAEHWLIHGAGHAWSGGSPRGTYTDAYGPDASREMLRFFAEHPRAERLAA
jgi:poly(hydroxyalkanoate) depolymerase family esterase